MQDEFKLSTIAKFGGYVLWK